MVKKLLENGEIKQSTDYFKRYNKFLDKYNAKPAYSIDYKKMEQIFNEK